MVDTVQKDFYNPNFLEMAVLLQTCRSRDLCCMVVLQGQHTPSAGTCAAWWSCRDNTLRQRPGERDHMQASPLPVDGEPWYALTLAPQLIAVSNSVQLLSLEFSTA